MKEVKIIQIQAMENNQYWQGCLLGLAEDGRVYISECKNNTHNWELYIDNTINNGRLSYD